MGIKIAILIIGALLGGIAFFFLPKSEKKFELPLIFTGAFLFAITITHILPEIFSEPSVNYSAIGIYILSGFLLQQVLDFFSHGVEHSHFHAKTLLNPTKKWSLMVALVVHSIMEGALLTLPQGLESIAVLMAILIHKMPAAFALMMTLSDLGKKAIYWLVAFSLASPIGLLLSDYLIFSSTHVVMVYALVAGSFIHISTTMLLEASPYHRFGFKKIITIMAGTLLAISMEYFI